jgi:nitrous oxidase accessory protein
MTRSPHLRWLGNGVVMATLAVCAPAGAAVLRVGTDAPGVAEAIEAARAGDIVEVPPGAWAGPVHIDKSITLRGRGGVIDGGSEGTVLFIEAPGARVEGITVSNSGRDVGAPDACIFIAPEATGAVVVDSTLTGCTFGIWVHETERVEISSNRIEGRTDLRVADRGNGIHLFDAGHLVVRGNEVTQARDGIYVSATEDSLIEGNIASGQRFGIHYMYSYRNTLRENVTNDNVIGMALMESHDLVVEYNEALRNERNGILFRDAMSCEIRGNRVEENGSGLFFFSSTENSIRENLIANNEQGMKIWAGTRRNTIEGNLIIGNREQVFYVGAEDQVWGENGRGNYWGDYIGWDHDGDGIGDRPHRVDSFKARLLYRFPAAVLLLHSPALEMLSHLSERLPLLRTPTIVDRAPLLDDAALRDGA